MVREMVSGGDGEGDVEWRGMVREMVSGGDAFWCSHLYGAVS